MIYVQLRARVKLAQGETLHVADAAKVLGSEKAGHCSLFCPTSPGVYTLDAIAVAKALKKVFPQEDISLIGAEVCYVHRIKARGKAFLRPVRTAAALLILLLGSALGLTWFHADVNMPQPQADVYAAITGAPPDDVRLITIPYCVGVMALGWQVAPALTNEEMLQTLLDTAAPNADGLRIIDPVHFIETLEREYSS